MTTGKCQECHKPSNTYFPDEYLRHGTFTERTAYYHKECLIQVFIYMGDDPANADRLAKESLFPKAEVSR